MTYQRWHGPSNTFATVSTSVKEAIVHAYRRIVLMLLTATPIIMALCSCTTLHSITPHITIGDVHADCILADELQRTETVTPLPEDHAIGLAEQWQLLKDHLVEEKGIADRSNDKTAFVNRNCVSTLNAASRSGVDGVVK